MKHYIDDETLMSVEKPSRYTGGEWNSVIKDKSQVDVRFAMCFADTYDIGMSHLGVKILYHLLNERTETWCERVFAPWTDMEDKMREQGKKLFALESQDEICNFDIIGFSLQYEMSYTNILNMLDLADLPLRSSQRTPEMPIILAGGPSANNPEPMAEFFDIYNLGEGEEMLPEIVELYAKCKKQGLGKLEFLRQAAHIEGVYVPAFYQVEYNEDGTIKAFTPREEYIDDAPRVITKRIVEDFNASYFPDKFVVPFTEVVHDRIMLEIFRGCTHGCRFCQAGYIYRPVRERSPEVLAQMAEKLIKSTGYEEISLLSLSTSDYSQLEELTDRLIEIGAPQKVNLGLPSLRVDSFSLKLMEKVSCVRKSGLTFAPEAGTQRLRDVINKGITEENILESVRLAFAGGWSNVKLYFMIGLPTETDEDVLGIAELAKKVMKVYYNMPQRLRKPEITVSVSTFVPKPFTPFEVCPQISTQEIQRRQILLRNALDRRFKYNWYDCNMSALEAAISRGDRRIGEVIYTVWKKGARFDAWSSEVNTDLWYEAFEECGLDPAFYVQRERSFDEHMPWDHVDVGVTKEHYKREYQKAMQGVTTPACGEKCVGCGVAKYKRGICVGHI